ncbi:hypothetical protein CROQUDRAFT_97550 [Cronartium quercuum f. sp. fusiforme G11]|uniref:Uncharacterized protein n=1 Tax=Cronartium quercuum f. sp. fusiforme G11 TaxID=708437 RepID=A0A9P6NA31_9BASI|nr:hypothetical protein CROQUDRAFT_97550 [Cronartium quercuum f. sp. fusiforme G11]
MSFRTYRRVPKDPTPGSDTLYVSTAAPMLVSRICLQQSKFVHNSRKANPQIKSQCSGPFPKDQPLETKLVIFELLDKA